MFKKVVKVVKNKFYGFNLLIDGWKAIFNKNYFWPIRKFVFWMLIDLITSNKWLFESSYL